VEINVMDRECTGRLIGDKETLTQKETTCAQMRNEQRKQICWEFTKERADKKLSRYYIP
jgi:hypothetical protein